MNAIDQRLSVLHAMRAALLAVRRAASPAERVMIDDVLARRDRYAQTLRELLAMTKDAVERGETPELWERVLGRLDARQDTEEDDHDEPTTRGDA